MTYYDFERELYNRINNVRMNLMARPLVLGGVASISGGSGGPPGGFIGYLPQNRVAYDTAELALISTPISGYSLLDNLNHIRYRIDTLENTDSGHVIVFNETEMAQRAKLTFSGSGVTVIDNEATNSTDITITSGSGTVTGSSAYTDFQLFSSVVIPSGGVQEIIFSGIPQTHKNLMLFMNGQMLGEWDATDIFVRFNDDAGNNYSNIYTFDQASDIHTVSTNRNMPYGPIGEFNESDTLTNFTSNLTATIYNYAGSGYYKTAYATSYYQLNNDADASLQMVHCGFTWLNTNPIISVALPQLSANEYYAEGTTIELYLVGCTESGTGGSSSGGHTIQDEGISLSQRTKLNFVGEGVIVTDDSVNDTTIVTIDTTTISGLTVATDEIWSAAGDLAIGTGNNSATVLNIGTSGYVLTSNGTTASWQETTTVSGGSGDVSTDNIWDAKGDLAVGTGSNTSVRLPIGSNGYVLTADSNEASGIKWAAISSNGGSGSTRYIDQSGGESDTYGLLVGNIDGSNLDFTVSQGSYLTGTLTVYRNGQLQTQGITPSGDWVESIPASGIFSFNTAPLINDELTVIYNITEVENAPADAYFVVTSGNSTLTNERVLTAGSGILITDSLPSIIISTYTDGWYPANEVWTYNSADDPTYVFDVDADVTTKYNIGMRVKLTQTTTKYFIITKVGAYADSKTPVTVYGGTDYDLADATITNPYYSMHKAPYGFPLDPTKWRVVVADTSLYTQASPVNGTWYNTGSLSISVPIGAWFLGYQATLEAYKSTATTHDVQMTLSTANNSESDTELGSGFKATNSTDNKQQMIIRKPVIVTSKTAYYLNIMSLSTGPTGIYIDGVSRTTYIRAECAYL